ncbi:MAG: hypothetical protein IJD22_00830 [Clostridia bacterium]|nr:hypothetical protein [Clostridia bacterium]
MKNIKRIFAATASLLLVLSLFSCTQGGEAGDTAASTEPVPESDTVSDSTTETAVPPEQPPSLSTYTLPLKWEKNGKVYFEYSYSPDGKSLSLTDHTEETPITYTVFFDDNGTPLRTEWTVAVNDTRTEQWRDDYYTDESGRITEEKRFCEGEIQNAYSYTYDEEGRLATQSSRNVKQENTMYRLLYDERGTHVATRYSKYNGESGYYMAEKTCTYDENGRIVKEESPDLTVTREYTLTGELVTGEKITSTTGDYSWSYYYSYTYENGRMTKKACSYGGAVTDTEYFCETEFEHYYNAVNWIFRERLP